MHGPDGSVRRGHERFALRRPWRHAGAPPFVPEAPRVAAIRGKGKMSKSLVRAALLVVPPAAAGAPHADMVSVLQAAPIPKSPAVGFHDSNVTVGTTTPDNLYNF